MYFRSLYLSAISLKFLSEFAKYNRYCSDSHVPVTKCRKFMQALISASIAGVYDRMIKMIYFLHTVQCLKVPKLEHVKICIK